MLKGVRVFAASILLIFCTAALAELSPRAQLSDVIAYGANSNGVNGFSQTLPLPSLDYDSNFSKFADTKVIQFQDASGQTVQVMTSHASQIPRSELFNVLDQIPKSQQRDIMLSYSEDLQSEVNQSEKVLGKFRERFLMPIANKYSQTKRHLAEAIHNDKFGIVVVTVNTLYDSFLWVQVDTMGLEQKYAMVAFNCILAVSFGFNKDTWSKMTKPLENKISTLLKQISNTPDRLRYLSSSFLSNLTFSLAIQGLRAGIVSYHDLANIMSSTHFWGTTLVLGSLMTLTSFGWSEQLAKVDELKNPVAKKLLRRLMEVRALFMGWAGPSGKLMQPATNGYFPLVATVLHGTLGIIALLNSDRIANWLEKNSSFQKIYAANVKIDNWINEKFKFFSFFNAAEASCSYLFEI